MRGTWRDHFAPIIAGVLERTAGQPEKDIRKALREAFPPIGRSHWPYKVWLSEIRRQRGVKRRRQANGNEAQGMMF